MAVTWKNRAIRALKESIAHWERLRDGTQSRGEDAYGVDCACCQEFMFPDERYSCRECPLYLSLGEECSRPGQPWPLAAGEFHAALYGIEDVGTAARQRMIDALETALQKVRSGEIKKPA
jgi:hypothetical protein